MHASKPATSETNPQHLTGDEESATAKKSWRMRGARWLEPLDKPFAAATRAVRHLQAAFPIGLLSRDELNRMVQLAYREAPDFYDPSRYRIRYEEQLLPLLARQCEPGAPLLDLYCGQGREAAIFAAAGYRVTAVDAHVHAINAARQRAAEFEHAITFVNADIDTWTPPNRDWSVIYTSLWMYSTVPDSDSRVDWLRRLTGWLAPQGILILSITPAESRQQRAVRMRHVIARAVAAVTQNPRSPEPGDRFTDRLFWHDFSQESIEQELTQAGLTIVERIVAEGSTPCIFYLVTPSGNASAPD